MINLRICIFGICSVMHVMSEPISIMARDHKCYKENMVTSTTAPVFRVRLNILETNRKLY